MDNREGNVKACGPDIFGSGRLFSLPRGFLPECPSFGEEVVVKWIPEGGGTVDRFDSEPGYRPESIGTQAEKTLHREIKNRICPDPACQEFPLGRYVADIFRDGRVTEIQTGSFFLLRAKLERLLPDYPVTVVYPVVRKKTIRTVDELGILSAPRKSPKVGSPLQIGRELPSLQGFLGHPRLDFLIYYTDVTEFRTRTLEGNGRKPWERIDRFPSGEPQEILLRTPEDFVSLLPQNLPETFTAAELAKAAKVAVDDARGFLAAGRKLGAFRECGKSGRAVLHRRAVPNLPFPAPEPGI